MIAFVDALILQGIEGEKQISGDGYYIYMWARSIVYDGDLRLTNDYQLCGDQFELLHWQKPGFEAPNWWGIGGSFAQIPFLFVGRLVYMGAGLTNEARLGCMGPIARFTMVSTPFLFVLTIVLVHRVARRFTEPRHALIGAAVAAYASPIYCYVYRFSAHNMIPSAFACALFVHEWVRKRDHEPNDEERSTLGWAWMGVLLGFIVLVRQQSVVFVLGPLVEWLSRVRSTPKKGTHFLRGVVFALCAFAVYTPQLYANKLMFGTYGDGRAGSYMFWTEPELAGPLFFPYAGLLTNSPILFLAFFGLGLEAFSHRKGREIARVLGAGFLLAAYIVACTWDWWGAAGYPGRRFCDQAVTFAIGGAFFAKRLERWFANRPRRMLLALSGVTLVVCALWSRNYIPQSGGPSSVIFTDRVGEMMRSVERGVGNPLAWPGSIPFAIRHHVHPHTWDRMNYWAVTWEDPMSRTQLNRTLFPGAPDHAPFFVSGFWPPAKLDGFDSRMACSSEPGVMLVPLFRSNIVKLVVRWRPLKEFKGPLRLRWNGKIVTIADDGPQQWNVTEVNVSKKMLHRGPNDGEVLVEKGCVALAEMDFFKDDLP